jgi:hypothetical protein
MAGKYEETAYRRAETSRKQELRIQVLQIVGQRALGTRRSSVDEFLSSKMKEKNPMKWLHSTTQSF